MKTFFISRQTFLVLQWLAFRNPRYMQPTQEAVSKNLHSAGKRKRQLRMLDICTCVLGCFEPHRVSRCCMPLEISERWHLTFLRNLRNLKLGLHFELRRKSELLAFQLTTSGLDYYDGCAQDVFGLVTCAFRVHLETNNTKYYKRGLRRAYLYGGDVPRCPPRAPVSLALAASNLIATRHAVVKGWKEVSKPVTLHVI